MLDADLESWLRLSLVSGLGVRSQLLLLRTFGEPAAIFSASRAELKGLVSPALIDGILHAAHKHDFPERQVTADWLESENHALITLDDPSYPSQLLSLPDPPTLLYAKGNLKLLKKPALSIVGSRNSTPQGVSNAEAFALHLSNGGMCIVSGLASGIDAAAHRGGLLGSGSSIAVIGTGIDRIYPASNRDLAHQLAKEGLILSEFALGSPPIAGHFPQRNRIIAALGLGCLVVEAALGSGSLITARQAVDIGREVFAIPGSIHSPVAKGCHALIKNGAKLVESADDILAELCFGNDLFSTSTQVEETTTVHESDSSFLDQLGWDPIDLETLIERTSLTNSALCEILLCLELEGKLASLPGGRYQRIGGGG
ncbi:DNA-processing protein DprA [Deefgea tanakiae]|uniref:DNA-processing protein DprA n=1 Tax=Deefgea tanakiae TaxID=2865840 RepID=A0ABX8Z6D8_9NEIS|nr:DNA-processing protein DprA [Deefgea tanakiae]QZA76598.1 DNA-processing protein DprA [Deefgea tanakiae]